MAPTLEKGRVKLHLRPKERAPKGRSGELVSEELVSEESSNKVGGASEEDGEHRSEEPRPATLLERGLVKLHLRPKESISEGPPKSSSPKNSSLKNSSPKKAPIRLVVPPKKMVNTAAKNPVRLLCWKGVWSNSTYTRRKASLTDPPKSSSPKKTPRMVALPKKMVNTAANRVSLMYVSSTIWSISTHARRKASLKDYPKSSSPKRALRMVALPKKMVNTAANPVSLTCWKRVWSNST